MRDSFPLENENSGLRADCMLYLDQTTIPHNVTLLYMWYYKGLSFQSLRFFFTAIYSFNSEKQDMALQGTLSRRLQPKRYHTKEAAQDSSAQKWWLNNAHRTHRIHKHYPWICVSDMAVYSILSEEVGHDHVHSLKNLIY